MQPRKKWWTEFSSWLLGYGPLSKGTGAASGPMLATLPRPPSSEPDAMVALEIQLLRLRKYRLEVEVEGLRAEVLHLNEQVHRLQVAAALGQVRRVEA